MKKFNVLSWTILSMAVILMSFLPVKTQAQLGSRVVVGYFHNWNNASAPYIRLKDVNPKYNVINIAFATPVSHTDMTMTFTPTQQTKAEFIADMRLLQSSGRRVQISVGGADAPVELKTQADRDKFVSSMKAIITEYGFDGYDIDLEGTSVILDAGDNNFKSSTTPKINYLVSASREIVTYFRGQGKDFWLTSAPEVQYVQGGYANYGTAYGGYLPVLYGLRDLLTFVHVQYYNTGSQVGLDEKIYSQGTADFIVSMTDMLLRGFPVARNTANVFPALREDQVAFGLPATNTGAAPAGGYVSNADVTKALNYLVKGISYGGQYALPNAYGNLRGIMTWSVNWDKTTGDSWVNNSYAFFSGLGGNIAPTVSITSPSPGSTFIPPANITINATASDSDGSVTKVEFFNGATKLGEDLTSPYSFVWSNVSAGTYSLTAKATDNAGAVTTSSPVNISGGTNLTLAISSPANNATFSAPASVTINANASTSSGTISKVEFFNGSTKLGEDLTSPYSYSWTGVSAGSYSLTAKATTSSSMTATSAVVNITVSGGTCSDPQYIENGGYAAGSVVKNGGNRYECKPYPYSGWCNGSAWAYAPGTGSYWQDAWTLLGTCSGGNSAPSSSITSPANNASFTAPASIVINANASDSDGTISKVDFYNGSTLLGTDNTSPYSFTWSNVGTGTYALTAVATDNLNSTGTSSIVNVTVNSNPPPTVSITSPANNTNYSAPASITINASASDNGSIAKVEFYQGTTKLGEDLASPYTYTWSGVANGTYGLTARATDNLGATATSATVTVTVSGDPVPMVSITSPANNASFAAPANITINATASDNGTISRVEFFQGTTKIGEDMTSPYSYTWNNVNAGTYSLSAKATDNAGGVGISSTVSVSVTSNPPPTVSISSPASGASFAAPASISITATASDNGSVSKVEFFNGAVKLGEDLSSPYAYTWTGVAAGSYTLTAKATDNLGAVTTSSAVNISVSGGGCTDPQYVENGGYVAGSRVKNVGNSYECKPHPYSGWCNGGAWAYAPGTGSYWQDAWTLIGPCSGSNNNAPSVSITAPANNTTITTVGSVVAINATASDTDGTVTKVEFFVDGSKVGEDATSPYAYSWTSTQGIHTLVAKATDNSANKTDSSPVTITVGSGNNSMLPARIMVGYWHTWNGGVPFIKLRDVNSNWDVINISFAEPVSPGSTDGRMKFVVGGLTADYTLTDFKNDIKLLQSRGKKIVLSIGGYEGYFSLGSSTAVTQFVNDIKGFITEYGFDGIDIDTEQSSVQFNPGSDPDFRNPTSPKVVNMISAIRQIVNSYGNNFILSWAPETFYFQMGKQYYGGLNGNVDSRSGVYIPMIHALRDRTTYVHAQLYNSSAMQGPDGAMYSMGTVEGIVAMCELVLQGFNVNNNSAYFFPALRPDQVVIGVPASAGAAGSGQISNTGLQQAFTTLKNRYPTMRGIMSWSINWDALQNANSFVTSNRNYLNGLGSARVNVNDLELGANEESLEGELNYFPNPVRTGENVHVTLDKEYKHVRVSIIGLNGVEHGSQTYQDAKEIDHKVPVLPAGLHILKVNTGNRTVIRKLITN